MFSNIKGEGPTVHLKESSISCNGNIFKTSSELLFEVVKTLLNSFTISRAGMNAQSN